MSKKIIINALFSQNIKFKIPFDTQNDTATFEQLKLQLLSRLEMFSKVATLSLMQEIPASFDNKQFALMDASGFMLCEQDLVSDICSNNDVVSLVHVDKISSSLQAISVIKQQPLVVQLQVDEPAEQIQSQNHQQEQQQNQQQQPDPTIDIILKNLQDKFFLNVDALSSFNSEQMQDESNDLKLKLIFPQTQEPLKSHDFIVNKFDTLLQLSQKLCKAIECDSDKITFVFYNHRGLPYHISINQIHQLTVEKSLGLTYQYNNKFFVYATRCNIGQKGFFKIDHEHGEHQVFVIYNGTKVIRLDLQTDNVLNLKQKIYSKLNIPTNSQNLNYGGKVLQDNSLLKDYNVQQNSNITLLIKYTDVVGYSQSFQDNFFTPWMSLFCNQSDEGLRQFRSHLYVISQKIENEVAFLGLIRDLSNNNSPLVSALQFIMNRMKLNQMQKIAMEEGFLRLFCGMILKSKTIYLDFRIQNLFESSRKLFAILINESQLLKPTPAIWQNQEIYMKLQNQCFFSLKFINKPALIQIDPTKLAIKDCQLVDYDDIIDKQAKKTILQKKDISTMSLTQPQWLLEQFEIVKLITHEIFVWIPQNEHQQADETLQLKSLSSDWHSPIDPLPIAPYKIYSSMELKQHPNTPVLTINSSKLLAIYTSMNKDIKNPVNLFEVISGIEKAENPDDMAFKNLVRMNTDANEEVIEEDQIDIVLVTQITVPPEEAIVVILDISGSMEEIFFGSEDLQRIGAVKAFFSAFADRTMAYNLKHVVSLAFFDDKYDLKCSFTEVFAQFKELVNRAKPRGATALFDSLMTAADSLNKIKQDYPQCLLRIIALTDGEDNQSKYKPEIVALKILTNNIILDSFVVGPKSDSLKQITHSTGGKCYCPKSLSEGLKLFEYETILSAKCRVEEGQKLDQYQLLNMKKVFNQKKKLPFDQLAHQIKLPNQIKRTSINPSSLIELLSADSAQLNVIAPSAGQKRIVKEMMTYQKEPHPFVKIFPCNDDITFWTILMRGPEDTPYFGGVFTLYIRFPDNYPFQAPEARFITPIYHCNINQQGKICHSILDRNYSPDTRVIQIINCIFGLLMTPEPDDPLDNTIASEYIQNLESYRSNATLHTQQHAMKSLDEVMKNILGNQASLASDESIHEKLEEIQKWVEESLNKKD